MKPHAKMYLNALFTLPAGSTAEGDVLQRLRKKPPMQVQFGIEEAGGSKGGTGTSISIRPAKAGASVRSVRKRRLLCKYRLTFT